MRAESRRMGNVERLLHFKRIPTLADVAAPQLSALAEHARERSFPRGSVLLRGGEPSPALHVLAEGRVGVRRRGRDLGEARPGSAISALTLLARDEEGVRAEALTDTVTLELEADALNEVLEDHFAILRHFVQGIARRLINLARRTPVIHDPGRTGPVGGIGSDLDLVERIFVLRQAAPFAETSVDALSELARGMDQVRVAPGATLWDVGESASTVHIVIDGEVRCTGPDGRVLLDVLPVTPLGEIEGVAGLPRWFRASTVTPVSLLSIDSEGVLDALEDNSEMALDYLATTTRWLLALLDRRAEEGDAQLGPFYESEAVTTGPVVAGDPDV